MSNVTPHDNLSPTTHDAVGTASLAAAAAAAAADDDDDVLYTSTPSLYTLHI